MENFEKFVNLLCVNLLTRPGQIKSCPLEITKISSYQFCKKPLSDGKKEGRQESRFRSPMESKLTKKFYRYEPTNNAYESSILSDIFL